MSATAYRPATFIEARKWDDRAAELLADPEAFYQKTQARRRTEKKRSGFRTRLQVFKARKRTSRR